jgi:hypothetical protein
VLLSKESYYANMSGFKLYLSLTRPADLQASGAAPSTPSPLQKIAFDQPNIAILNFPFSWLPTFIVPIVLLGHLVSIRQLLKEKTNKKEKIDN